MALTRGASRTNTRSPHPAAPRPPSPKGRRTAHAPTPADRSDGGERQIGIGFERVREQDEIVARRDRAYDGVVEGIVRADGGHIEIVGHDDAAIADVAPEPPVDRRARQGRRLAAGELAMLQMAAHDDVDEAVLRQAAIGLDLVFAPGTGEIDRALMAVGQR
jgi:hypothetical protein